MPNRLRVAIIGAGAFACRYHIPHLQERDDCEICAIVKRDSETRRMVQARFDIRAGYADAIEMLDHEKPDAAIIASPHHAHFEQSKACLDRNIPALVEKPLTIDPKEARALCYVAKQRNVPLLAAYNRRVDRCYRQAEKMIREGMIGEVRFIEGRRFYNLEWMLSGGVAATEQDREKWWPDTDRVNFRSNPNSMGGGFLDDGGTHILDAALWLAASSPVSVSALTFNNQNGVEIRSSISVSFKNNIMASIVCCGDADPALWHEIVVHGSEGTIVLAKESITCFNGAESFTPEVKFPALTTTGHFIDVAKGDAAPLCGAENAVDPIQLARDAFESSQTGKTVKWNG